MIFETNEISYHGVIPVSPSATVPRQSFATYYYTREAPAHWTGVSHSAIFKARPDVRQRLLFGGNWESTKSARSRRPFTSVIIARATRRAAKSSQNLQDLVTAPALTIVKHVVGTRRRVVQFTAFAGIHGIAGDAVPPVPGCGGGGLIDTPSIILTAELATELAAILADILTGILTGILHIDLSWHWLGRN